MFEKRAGDTFYCHATANSLSESVNPKYKDDAGLLGEHFFRILARRFCKAEEVEYYVCMTYGYFYKSESLGSFCTEPPGLDRESFVECTNRGKTFHGEKLQSLLEVKNKELLALHHQSNMEEVAFLEQYYLDTCSDLLKEISENKQD